MAQPKRIAEGDRLPFFLYDTPYSSQNRFRDLLAQQAPLVLVFMANFGHPITRNFANRYAASHHMLQSGGFALVVRSRADKLASIGPDTLPYPLLCDAEGVLYDRLMIPQSTSTLMSCSLEGWRILREAKKQGYRPAKNSPQQLPLTLILDRDGTVLFCHYGASLTDVPADCAAMQSLLEELELVEPPQEEAPLVEYAPDDEVLQLLQGVEAFRTGSEDQWVAPLPGEASDDWEPSGKISLYPDL